MVILKGDIFQLAKDYRADAICCTTNKVVKGNGELVMGAGVAKAFAREYPWLPAEWGHRINRGTYSGDLNCFATPMYDGPPHFLIYFATKALWQNPSTVEIIRSSLLKLQDIILTLDLEKVLLPKPGCNNGGLDWSSDIRPMFDTYIDGITDRILIVEK